ncbi:MAG: hypothetical protein HY270_17870 [Deltaproteobacteria bacterium]|nr:hypothetical protein [Deltaproteobacteria bacterium]
MMESEDARLLAEMQRLLLAFRLNLADVGPLADRLLAMRDRLTFQDRDWSFELTQHIATLDSASTFTPANEAEAHQLRSALVAATNSLLELIEAKVRNRNDNNS